MLKIPNEILIEFQQTKKTFPKAWIGFNASINKFFVYIFPKSFTNSLLITEIKWKQ